MKTEKIEKINGYVEKIFPIVLIGAYLLFFPFAFIVTRKWNWSGEDCVFFLIFEFFGAGLLFCSWNLFYYSKIKTGERLERIGNIITYSDMILMFLVGLVMMWAIKSNHWRLAGISIEILTSMAFLTIIGFIVVKVYKGIRQMTKKSSS